MNNQNQFSKNLDENRAYQQGYQLGRAGASRAKWQPIMRTLPKRLQAIFELGRTDGFIDSIQDTKK